ARVARMGLATLKMDTPADTLSGGEKARLLMGLATFDSPNLLILDEPTNHLDIDSREALVHALNDFPGAVILISHDRHMVEATVDRLWLVGDGTVTRYEGDLDEYKQLILSARRGGDARDAGDEAKTTKVDQRRDAAQKRETLAPLRKEIKAIETKMAKLQTSVADLDVKLADVALYTRDPSQAAKLAKQRSDAVKSIGELEEQWLARSEEHDSAMAD
ncbi:ATP-binding cassette domain-containing protein, partial [bacterium]